MNRETPKNIQEAISNGLNDGLGKPPSEVVIAIEREVKDFLAQKACSKDIELDRAFRLFCTKIFGGTL